MRISGPVGLLVTWEVYQSPLSTVGSRGAATSPGQTLAPEAADSDIIGCGLAMWFMIPLLILTVVIVGALLLRRRLDTSLRIDIESGRPRVVHGDADSQLLRDIENICSLWNIHRGSLRFVNTRRGPRVRCKGAQITPYRRTFQNALDNPL